MSQQPPHTPAGPNGPDRRKHPRFPTHGRLLGWVPEAKRPVAIRDIGFGGFAAETVDPLPIGSVHHIRFTTKSDRSAVLAAKSLHCWPSCMEDGSPCYVTGFEFIAEPPDAQRDITMLIEQVTSIGLFD
jgi:hypothetical protein